ncbi:MAG: hypothetical protein DI549_08275 [Ancylobacter novellus]|uniref:Lipoprotein n=1 Tax=Ancylobacter novellus TaxID=921 RepID=A0A2W5SVC4_ANCNO|nr:MAG: hypothetical protein DI549_08275 [Ancylobacter novellus]
MKKLIVTAVGALLLLGCALLVPRMPLSDSRAEAANVVTAAPKGYRTCFTERRLVSTGTPRLESTRRCVFDD